MNYNILAEQLVAPKSILESYLDNDFLSCINESVVEKDLKKQIDLIEARIKSGKIQKSDYNKFESMLKEAVKDPTVQIPAGMIYGVFLAYAGLGLEVAGVTMYGNYISAIVESAAIAVELSSIILMINSSKNIKTTVKQFNNFYDKVMKKEAKAKVELKKSEALDDGEEKKIKKQVYTDIIKACENIRKNYKSILREIENNTNKRTDDYSGKFAESVSLTESGDIILEMKGDDFKNELFIQIMEDANEYFTMRYEYIKNLDAAISKIISAGKSINDDNIGKYIVEFRKVGRELNASTDKASETNKNIVKRFRRNINKFNNKYSEIGMKERQKLNAKVREYLKAVDDIWKKYDAKTGSMNNEIIKVIDTIEANVDPKNPKITELIDIIQSWTNGIHKACEKVQAEFGEAIGLTDDKLLKLSAMYMITNFKQYRAESKAQRQKIKDDATIKKMENKEIRKSNKEFKKRINDAKYSDNN